MPQDAKDAKNSNRRTRLKELPEREKPLTPEEQKKIKGGPDTSQWLPGIKTGGGGSGS